MMTNALSGGLSEQILMCMQKLYDRMQQQIPASMPTEALHLKTPTIHSLPMSKKAGFPVYLKLENMQVPGSFKIRGIGHFCKKVVEQGCKRIVCASGGNAGLAAAYAARRLNVPATIVLPSTTPGFVADKLRDEGAEVEIQGDVWDKANSYALQLAEDPDLHCAYVHPFDHPSIWEGHESLVLEASQQLASPPDVVIASVGGGGLLNGILQGMWKVGWDKVPVVAMETVGADCLNAALKAGSLVTLPAITSVAKCLGALTASKTTYEYCQKHKVISHLVTDSQAVEACLQFADDHRYLVEPACGATLAAIYSNVINDLQKAGQLGTINCALVVVCGGSGVSLEALQSWKHDLL